MNYRFFVGIDFDLNCQNTINFENCDVFKFSCQELIYLQTKVNFFFKKVKNNIFASSNTNPKCWKNTSGLTISKKKNLQKILYFYRWWKHAVANLISNYLTKTIIFQSISTQRWSNVTPNKCILQALIA